MAIVLSLGCLVFIYTGSDYLIAMFDLVNPKIIKEAELIVKKYLR